MAQKGGILGGLDFTTGKVDDGQKVVCLVRQDQKSCDRNNQAIKLNPNDADAYYNRRIAHSDLGDKQSAIADYDQAIKINPNYVNAYYNRGLAHSDLGDKQSAIADYDQAIKINPNYANAYYSRGLVH